MACGHRTLLLLAALTVTSCVPPAPVPPPAPPPAPALSEEIITPPERLDTAIIDFRETATTDGKTVTVSGTLVNRGTRATRQVNVHLEALDRNGAVVLSVNPSPSSQTILPGSTATFVVTLEKRADIDRYHVEAISR